MPAVVSRVNNALSYYSLALGLTTFNPEMDGVHQRSVLSFHKHHHLLNLLPANWQTPSPIV